MANAQRNAIHESENVQSFLDRYARALTSGDSKTVAAMWETPALVLGHSEHLIGSGGEIERMFAGASEGYKQRGIVDTKAVVEREQRLSDTFVLVDVRWPYLDGSGKTVGEEASTYILRRDGDDHLRIRVAVSRDG